MYFQEICIAKHNEKFQQRLRSEDEYRTHHTVQLVSLHSGKLRIKLWILYISKWIKSIEIKKMLQVDGSISGKIGSRIPALPASLSPPDL